MTRLSNQMMRNISLVIRSSPNQRCFCSAGQAACPAEQKMAPRHVKSRSLETNENPKHDVRAYFVSRVARGAKSANLFSGTTSITQSQI